MKEEPKGSDIAGNSQGIDSVGEVIDKLMTINVHYKFGLVDVVTQLYESARRSIGSENRPVTAVAAEKLVKAVKPGSKVIVATGWRSIPQFPYGETDGPPGAAILARAILIACQATPVLVCEQDIVPVLAATSRAAGLNVHDLETAARSELSVNIRAFPMGNEAGKQEAKKMVAELRPSCIISIERPGRNEKGEYHFAWEKSASAGVANVDYLFEEAARSGIFTIGIGDVGNELGLGGIKESIKRFVKTGSKCKCPCNSGIASHDKADIAIVAATSNWGAYGASAALAVIKKNLNIFHTPEVESRMLHECARSGAVDAKPMCPSPSVDGLSEEVNVAIVRLMRTVIERGITAYTGIFEQMD